MRQWIDLLTENSLTKYRPMFGMFPADYMNACDKIITKVHEIFKGRNQDKMLWALKWLRLYLVTDYGANYIAGEYHRNTFETSARLALIDKFSKDLNVSSDEGIRLSKIFSTRLDDFEHFFDLPIPEIQNYQFGKKEPYAVILDFDKYEQKFKEASKQEVMLKGNEEIILDFKDGYVWMDLHRSGCQQEAASMGHCGNGAGKRGETILSLRKHIRSNIYRPVLTFILDGTGRLGEMKGRGNNKPAEKYHKYIVGLLKLPRITGIKGGGYMPENNFKLSDMGDEGKKIADTHPHLLSIRDLYERYEEEEDADKIAWYEEKIENLLPDSLEADWGNKNILIGEYETFDSIQMDIDLYIWEDHYDIKEGLIDELGFEPSDADKIATFFDDNYLKTIKDDYAKLARFYNYSVYLDKHPEQEKWIKTIDMETAIFGQDVYDDDGEIDHLNDLIHHGIEMSTDNDDYKELPSDNKLLQIFLDNTIEYHGSKSGSITLEWAKNIVKLYKREMEKIIEIDSPRFDFYNDHKEESD